MMRISHIQAGCLQQNQGCLSTDNRRGQHGCIDRPQIMCKSEKTLLMAAVISNQSYIDGETTVHVVLDRRNKPEANARLSLPPRSSSSEDHG